MERLTLDTNTVRDWAWCEGLGTENRYGGDEFRRAQLTRLFEKLKALRDNGMCEIGVTTQLFTDYHEVPSELPQHIQDMIGPYVTIATPGLFMFPLVVPYVLAEKDVIEGIFNTVFPHSQPRHRKHDSNRKDALQLYAHRIAGRDFFLTVDKMILRKKVELADDWGIQVSSLDEYLTDRNYP